MPVWFLIYPRLQHFPAPPPRLYWLFLISHAPSLWQYRIRRRVHLWWYEWCRICCVWWVLVGFESIELHDQILDIATGLGTNSSLSVKIMQPLPSADILHHLLCHDRLIRCHVWNVTNRQETITPTESIITMSWYIVCQPGPAAVIVTIPVHQRHLITVSRLPSTSLGRHASRDSWQEATAQGMCLGPLVSSFLIYRFWFTRLYMTMNSIG